MGSASPLTTLHTLLHPLLQQPPQATDLIGPLVVEEPAYERCLQYLSTKNFLMQVQFLSCNSGAVHAVIGKPYETPTSAVQVELKAAASDNLQLSTKSCFLPGMFLGAGHELSGIPPA